MRRNLTLIVLLFVLASAGSAWADTVGTPVSGIGGSAVAAANVGADGTVNFYIPLQPASSGVFGVGGVGTSADICTFGTGGTCTGGTLTMFLKFSPVSPGTNLLSLQFNDLDLIGVNDPWFFLESVEIFEVRAGNVLQQVAFVDSSADAPPVVPGQTNANNQLLRMNVAVDSDPFYAKLKFTTSFDPSTPPASYMNTVETVRATVSSVPEPTTLSLLGFGLIGIGLASRRRTA